MTIRIGTQKEKAEHKHFDFLEGEFEPSLYLGFPVTILNVKNINGLYQIKSIFASLKQQINRQTFYV